MSKNTSHRHLSAAYVFCLQSKAELNRNITHTQAGAMSSKKPVMCHTPYTFSQLLFHCVALRCVALRCVALRCVALRCVALRCVALRCVALRCVALRCVALRCVALHTLIWYHIKSLEWHIMLQIDVCEACIKHSWRRR